MRRTKRSNAGAPPEWFDEKYLTPRHRPDSPDRGPSRSNMSSHSRLTLAGRSRRSFKSQNADPPKDDDEEAAPEQKVLPQAAFPTKDFANRGRKKSTLRKPRDPVEVDIEARPQGLLRKRSSSKAQLYLLDGTWIDSKGHTMHGIADYYNNHVSTHANTNKCDILHHIEDFRHLHFKLQYTIFSEIKEDLSLYPLPNAPQDGGISPGRCAREILGISGPGYVKRLKMQIQSNDDEGLVSLPEIEDYGRAKRYLCDMGLPLTLIELYRHLEDGGDETV